MPVEMEQVKECFKEKLGDERSGHWLSHIESLDHK